MTTKIKAGVIGDGVVGTSAIADDAITSAKLDTNIAVAGTLTVTGDATFDTSTLVVDTTNDRVGIGTSSPAAELHVSGDSIANTFKLIANSTVSGSDATIFRPADNTMAFSTNGLERMRIDSSGNVQIDGTEIVNNSDKGKINLWNSSSRTYALQMYHSGAFGSIGMTGAQILLLKTDDTQRIRITSPGTIYFYNEAGTTAGFTWDATNSRVGIGTGTTSPSSILHIEGDTNSYTTAPILYFGSTSTADAAVRDWAIGPADSNYGDFHIYQGASTGASPLATSNAKFTINSSGNVGIGTTSPSGEFHVDSALAPCDIHFTTGSSGGTGYDVNLNLTGGANNSEMNLNMGIAGNADREQIKTYQSTMRFITADTERMRITSTGTVEAGTSTTDYGANIINWTERNWIGLTGDLPGYSAGGYPVLKTPFDYLYISVNGIYSAYISGNGTYTANSDERLKTNITTLPSGQLDKVANLRGVNFEWLDTNRGEEQQLGVIAQEIEAEYPELVTEGVEDIKGVNYAGLVVPLIEAIKELKIELDAAKARITTLEG